MLPLKKVCHIDQLFNMKIVPIKVYFTILKYDIISYMLTFQKTYYDESRDQVLNKKASTSTIKFK